MIFLAALAALAATSAFAQSSVSITGIMDAGYQTGKEFGQTAKTVTQNGSRTTAIKFIAVEDLGSGLKAKFQFEADPAIAAADGNKNNATAVTTADAFANGAAQKTGQASAQSGLVGAGYNYVGLAGNFGEVQFGTLNTQTLATFGVGSQNFGTAVGSGYKKGIYAGYTRYENSMLYITPTFKGLSGRFQQGVGNDSAYGSTTTVTLRRPEVKEIGLNYVNGPITAAFANLTSTSSPNEATADANVKTKTNTFAVAYDFGVAKVAYGLQKETNDQTTAAKQVDTKASNLSVTVPYGNFKFLANTGSLTGSAGSFSGKKNTLTGLGVHYNFSKNTYLYVLNESQTIEYQDWTKVVSNGAALTGAPSDNKRSITTVGLSMAF